ncbi:MAG: hypothetical protein ACXWPM_12290 [Bdellovibrionota bacterium]
MRSLLVLSAVVAASAMGLAGCEGRCQQAREQIITPMQTALGYLSTDPDGNSLAHGGCDTLLKLMETIPGGAQLVRDTANSTFTDTYSRCVDWVTAYRYRCYTNNIGQQVCYQERYLYCGHYEYFQTHEEGYQEAVDLSAELDQAYDRTHHLCGQAINGNLDAARAEARDLVRFLVTDVKPRGDKVYALACGK